MTRWTVDSSMFIALSYDPVTRHLELELHNGAVWRCLDIPPGLVEQMLAAPSKGKFFHAWVKDLFELVWLRDLGGRPLATPPEGRMSA